MSIEALLLFALFVLVPVIEQLIARARRRRAERNTAETRAEPDAVRSLPVDAPPTPTAIASAGPVPHPPARQPSLPRQSRNRSSTTWRERLRRPDHLREAMIMRIVLGPCRALHAAHSLRSPGSY